jgi:hypothetical protein
LNFAASGIILASFAEQFLYAGTDLRRVVLPLAVIVVGNTFVLVTPVVRTQGYWRRNGGGRANTAAWGRLTHARST